MAPLKNILFVGLGPHARRIYYPLLEKYAEQYDLRVPLLVDLADQRDRIESYLAQHKLQPQEVLYLDTGQRQSQALDAHLLKRLDELVAAGQIDGMILSTEPAAHKPYLLWAVQHDIDVLMDKPITAPLDPTTDPAAARQIFEDYVEIEQHLRRSRANVIVQCQRRSHAGYQFIRQYLADFVQQYQVPLSFLDIYHADGMWAMPNELFERENHPYKYGYGKLMHSGYHFIDLFAWLTGVNDLVAYKSQDTADLVVRRFRPYDFLHQMDAANYGLLLGSDEFGSYFDPAMLEHARSMGEIDAYILCQLKRGDVVVTTGSINLQQNSFSRRAWVNLPEDIYKGNGRVRHERMTVQVANLLNIQVHSYQSYEVNKRDVDTTGAGHEHHFEIYIFRNSHVVGGEPLEKFDIGEFTEAYHRGDQSFLGHNEQAREVHFLDFLEGRPGASPFFSHRRTNLLLSHIYQCIAAESNGGLAHMVFPYARETLMMPHP